MFAMTSRYFSIPTAKLETADGETIVYVRRRSFRRRNGSRCCRSTR